MNTPFRRLLLTSSIALAIVSSSVFAGPATQDVTEARQEVQIWTTYALNPYLRANDLQVSVHQGTATLTGSVDEDVNKELAKQIALGVSGVKQVDNQIVVQGDYVPAKGTKSQQYGDVIDDATITAAVKSKLAWSKYASAMDTNVTTKAGKVTLTGTAESTASRDLVIRLTRNTRGVISVDNQLKIGVDKPTVAEKVEQTADVAEQKIADSWITTKVKSTFMYSNNVRSSDIDVSTSNGIVTLSGKVDTGAERELAIELAKNVRGVRDVESKSLVL